MSVADIRRSYDWSELSESTLAADPITQLGTWVQEAIVAGLIDPTAMSLATVDATGRPSVRIVLLKSYDEHGLVFFTNYESRKGRELAANPQASVLFYWPGLERQIRLEGQVSKISAAESDAYYHSRPLASQLGAWASPQSQPISREQLEARMRHYTETLGEHPQRPPFWGGYRLAPDYVEFWQGRASRLHDRFIYTRDRAGHWQHARLAP